MTAPSDAIVVTCPGCAADTIKLLDFSSSISLVWYLRCNSCGHVWSCADRRAQVHRSRSPNLPQDGVSQALDIRSIVVDLR